MTPLAFITRSLRYYWRTHVAVALGVGVAVATLAGALVVGESVRASLRDLALARLGSTDQILTASGLFTEQFAERIASTPSIGAAWTGSVPVLALEGTVTHERSGTRARSVQVFGVDDRFWRFHEAAGVGGPEGRAAYVSGGLAAELGIDAGDALLLRVQTPSTVPAGIIQGRRDEPGRAVRVSAARVLTRAEAGEFSPRPSQGAARAIFVPLERLQRDLDLPHRINLVLFGERAGRGGDPRALLTAIETKAELADLGVRLRALDGAYVVESEAGLLTDPLAAAAADAAREIGVEPVPVLTYLATAIKANGREIPYSLVSALPQASIAREARHADPAPWSPPASSRPAVQRPIWLSEWAASDLQVRPGDSIELEYYLWSDVDGLTSTSASFTLAGILPMAGLAVDQDLTPEYPGVSTSANITDWDPPFPVDLRRIRPKDEEYWDKYLTAPKAFIAIEDGQALWRSRYGQVSSLRVPRGAREMTSLHAAYREALPNHVQPSLAQFRLIPARADALAAASGTTDFGEYFTYFSFFLVVSSLLLTSLFFRLGVEQRAREIGILTALGYTAGAVRRLLLGEAAVVAAFGASLGIAGALAYAWVVMLALRTWWLDAVNTTQLVLHASPGALALGATGGFLAALACVWWSLRALRRSSTRGLLSGGWTDTQQVSGPSRHIGRAAAACAIAGVTLAFAAHLNWLPTVGGFFGSGLLLLAAGLFTATTWLRCAPRRAFALEPMPMARLGARNARYRPARSVMSIALIASATFLIVSVGAFRRGPERAGDRASGTGGFSLIAETISPVMHDPGTPAGRAALNLPALRASVARFRLRPGDDASCLNLYRPRSPRLLGATSAFRAENRFSFASTIAGSDAERANPWTLLERRFEDGAVPVIGDATSLTYVFHLQVGDIFEMQGPDGRPLRLRIVGALRDSVLQSELIMSEAEFVRLFPRQEGYRVFLVDAAPGDTAPVAEALESGLADFGLDVQSTADRLASYHGVENTFLSTFQALGALGLILGTLGLGTVLLRNVLERRRELALLRATGYRVADLVAMLLAECTLLLLAGLGLGVAAAAVAIAPAWLDRAHEFPVAHTLLLLTAVVAAGLLSTVVAVRAVSTPALLPALRNE